MQKQVIKNVIEQKSQQVDPDLTLEYCNYNFEITLLPFLDVIDHKTWSIDKARSLVRTDPISINLVDIVLAHLSLNTKQKIIMRKVICHTMYNQATPRSKQLDQLLLVVKGKGGVNKSQVIKAINRAYNVIGKIDQIYIIALTGAVADNISRNTLHSAIGIDIPRIK